MSEIHTQGVRPPETLWRAFYLAKAVQLLLLYQILKLDRAISGRQAASSRLKFGSRSIVSATTRKTESRCVGFDLAPKHPFE